MVHNGIEYADMQLIAEAYDLLRFGIGLDVPTIKGIFDDWNAGDLESFLIEITATVLDKVDAETGKPLVDVIVDQAEQKGTGRWTAQDALELGVPLTGITEAVFARSLSSALRDQRRDAAGVLAGPKPGGLDESLVDDIRKALYASKVVAYAQGFEQMAAAASTYDWDLQMGELAKIWRGGCIIRARFLNRITESYGEHPDLVNLLMAPYFRDAVADAQDAWRKVIVSAVEQGVAVPAFSSSLAYYDGYRRERGPANLIQGQRDFFGAHTYRRVDKEGSFHTRWSQDGSEVQDGLSADPAAALRGEDRTFGGRAAGAGGAGVRRVDEDPLAAAGRPVAADVPAGAALPRRRAGADRGGDAQPHAARRARRTRARGLHGRLVRAPRPRLAAGRARADRLGAVGLRPALGPHPRVSPLDGGDAAADRLAARAVA